jgi:hypothetical protein
MAMRTVRLMSMAVAGIIAFGCSASLPTDPSFTSLPARLVVHYPIAGTNAMVGVSGGSTQFEAYTIDTDGVWTRVTTQATWSSSDNQALPLSSGSRGVFTYRAGGRHVISATHQGLQGTLSVDVRDTPAFPYLHIQTQDQSVGISNFTSIFLQLSSAPNGRQQLMPLETTLVSSDESIATIDKNGRFMRVSPGNVRITVTHGGLTDWHWRSVPPFEQ